MAQMARGLKEGYEWNPLRKYPPNMKCFCESGKKAKACCLPHVPLAVPKAEAQKLSDAIKRIRNK